jgi:hypothetical protein
MAERIADLPDRAGGGAENEEGSGSGDRGVGERHHRKEKLKGSSLKFSRMAIASTYLFQLNPTAFT